MIGVIIQARMGSSRLPGKVLKNIGAKTLLEHIIFRLQKSKSDILPIIATSTETKDNPVEEFCRKNNVTYFRGSELNVLERYYQCALKYKFDHVVRMTGDNPFPDIDELDNLIKFHIQSENDYSECFSTLPIGVGMEIFTFNALEQSMFKSTQPHHFEHVDEYILENKDLFKCGVLSTPVNKNKPEIRLTIDTEDDYKKACFIVENSNNDYIDTEEAIRLCLQYV